MNRAHCHFNISIFKFNFVKVNELSSVALSSYLLYIFLIFFCVTSYLLCAHIGRAKKSSGNLCNLFLFFWQGEKE